MNFNKTIDYLDHHLDQPLPGYEAQRKMAPLLPDGQRFNFSHTKAVKQGAVLILFYPSNDKVMFPLIQRPQYNGVHSGQVALPGGKQDDIDHSLVQTALREANEEIGIDHGKVKVLGTLTELYVQASNINVLPVIGYTKEKLSFRPDRHEVEEVMPTNLYDLLDSKKHRVSDIKVRQEISLRAPFFDLHEKVVWGATAMILSELVEIFRNY